MHHKRVVLLLGLALFCCTSALAQNPGPQFWRKVGCEPFEPRTELEKLDELQRIVLVKAFTRITTVEVRGVRIDAVHMRPMSNVWRPAKGIVVVLRESGEEPKENRAFVDYEEIEALLNAIDTMSRVDETTTPLPGFEATYRTAGDFEINVFRQTQRGTAVTLRTGICDRTAQGLTLDELAKVRAMIQEAKTRLDELR
ncbi:MAG TPA: hypothetical protein VFT02_11120 [Pyrinomonadaceae bacterium]|nr:hypothetical protein [Pyrinomonadaceae bacterium]